MARDKRFTTTQIHPLKKMCASALLDMGEPKNQICKALKISDTSLRIIAEDSYLVPEKVAETKKTLGSRFYMTAARALEATTNKKLAESSAPQLMMAAGIAVDKARLLEGLSTVITETRSRQEQDLAAELASLEAKIKGSAVDAEVVVPRRRSRPRKLAIVPQATLSDGK